MSDFINDALKSEASAKGTEIADASQYVDPSTTNVEYDIRFIGYHTHERG